MAYSTLVVSGELHVQALVGGDEEGERWSISW